MSANATMPILLLLVGCETPKEDTGAEGPGTTQNQSDCTTDDQCGDGQICEATACIAGDRDNSPEEATAIFYEEDHNGVINPAEDVDWWAIQGTGGHFIRISTVDIVTEAVDTVVSLYDTSGHRLAWEDGYAGGTISGADTWLYAYIPEDGNYLLKVEDVGTFYDDPEIPPAGSDKAQYTLTVNDLGKGGDETDSLQDAGYTVSIEKEKVVYAIPVAISSDGESDFTRLNLPFSDAPLYFFTMQHDDGSDASLDLKLYDQHGDLVFQKQDPSRDVGAQLIATAGRQYVLEASDHNGKSGSTYWGWVFVLMGAEGDGNPREQEPNDTSEQATILEGKDQNPSSGTYISYYTQGTMVDPLDLDVFGFELVEDDMYVSLALGAQDYGGLLVPRLELLDSSGTVLETIDSSVGTDNGALNLGTYPKGSYFLRVSGQPDSVTVGGEGYFYKLGIHTSTFEFSS